MPVCKVCRSKNIIKNGIVRDKQRYRCRECGYTFVEGDERIPREAEFKKAAFSLLRALYPVPLRDLAKFLKVWPSQLCRWGDTSSQYSYFFSSKYGKDAISELADSLRGQENNTGNSILVARGELWSECTITIILEAKGAEKGER